MPMRRTTTILASELQRYAGCPRAYQLHDLEGAPAASESSRLASVIRRACAGALRDHAAERRSGGLEPASVVAAYRNAWEASGLSEPASFEEGLEIVKAWGLRQGVVQSDDILAVDQPYRIEVGHWRVTGTMDRADRVGDALRVRIHSTARVPMSRDEADASLQVALCDLAGLAEWPCASRVEVEVELLRHGHVLRIARSEEQREATRAYLIATLDQIEATAQTGADFPARPGLRCASCDTRDRCPAYADALAARRTFVCTSAEDLAAVSREREEVARLVRVLSDRKEELEAVLRARIKEHGELQVAGMRYTLGTATLTEYPVGPTLEALARITAQPQEVLLERLASIRAPALRKLVDELAPSLSAEVAAQLRGALDSLALRTFSQRFVAKEAT